MKDYIYHITTISNLENIIKHDGLLCKTEIDRSEPNYVNIAYEGIQNKRHTKLVPLTPGGVLHDYVPFYFAPRSPMLYAIHTGCIEHCTVPQKEIIYLVVKISEIKTDLAYVFTDGHAIMDFSSFYNELSQLSHVVDWKIMGSKYWNDDAVNPDRKRKRQAEFLIHKKVPNKYIAGIAVYDKNAQDKVIEVLTNSEIELNVLVKRNWYY